MACRAHFGPGLWPGPRRQARWAGRGLRRSRAGLEDRFCEAVGNDLRVPLTREGSAQIMRGSPVAVTSSRLPGPPGASASAWPWCWRVRQRIRRGPQAAGHLGCRARQPTRLVGFRPKGAAKKLPPRNGETPGLNPGRLRRVTWPLIPSRLLAPVLAPHRQGRQARRAGGAPLKP
jgi:hypothetical protein